MMSQLALCIINAGVCGSDGNTYPSMCHMMVESRGDMIPRARHREMCSEREMRPSDEVDEDDMDRVKKKSDQLS